MLKVSDFAKIARVSVKTLHHYDEISLLRPELIQPGNGYRYYSLEQLPRLNRIIALKDLGFTLQQIRAVLNKNLSIAEMHGMLKLKEAELEDHIQQEQERLESVKMRLHQIEQEGTPHDYDIRVKSVPSQVVASARGLIPLTDNSYLQCQKLAIAIVGWLQQVNGRITGPWCSLYHETAYENNNERFDIEMAVEVESALLTQASLPSSDLVKVHMLPASDQSAYLLHYGEYDGLWNAHLALMEWIEAGNYSSVGPYRCIYLHLQTSAGGDKPLIELQIPIQQKV